MHLRLMTHQWLNDRANDAELLEAMRWCREEFPEAGGACRSFAGEEGGG